MTTAEMRLAEAVDAVTFARTALELHPEDSDGSLMASARLQRAQEWLSIVQFWMGVES